METIRWLVAGAFVLVAFAAFRLQMRYPSASTTWLVWMFATLAAALVTVRLLPVQRTGGEVLLGIAASAFVVAFPYLLFRFAESFQPVSHRARAVATLVAVLLVGGTVAAQAAVHAGDGEPGWYRLFVLGVVAAWTGLTGWAVARLWAAGRGQMMVTRRRMRTMAGAGAFLNVALVLAGVGRTELLSAVAQGWALASGLGFLLAFSPPRFLRAMWRQGDERALWQAEGALVAADTQDAVLAAVLPHLARLLGGGGALFVDLAGHESQWGDDRAVIDRARGDLALSDGPEGVATLRGSSATLVLSQGRLAVAIGPHTPLFGQDELELMERIGALLDLSLSRVEASLTTATLAAFEQGLIPQISSPAGLLVDTRYRAGQDRLRLGGDFMDVVDLPDGAAGFVVGDVSGHGPAEAAFAVGVHAGWRTLAKVHPLNPATWFALLDETFFDDHLPERLVTAIGGRIDIARRTVTLSSAGHCPPIVIGQDSYLVDVANDPLLGVGHTERRKERTVTLEPGQALFLYTDGLVEQPQPDQPDRRWREEDLLAWLNQCDDVSNIDLDALLWHFGRNSFADDVAVMLLRCGELHSS